MRTTASRRAADRHRRALRRRSWQRGRADWATTGGSTPIGVYNAIVEMGRGTPSRGMQVHTWWGDDRFVPADHPLSNATPFDDILLEAGGWECVHSDDDRVRVRVPADNVHPFRTGRAIGAGGGADWCAQQLADELRAAELPETRRLAGLRPHVHRDRRRRAHALGVPWVGGVRLDRLGARDPGAEPHRAARRAGHAEPVDRPASRAASWPSCSAHPRRTSSVGCSARSATRARCRPSWRSATGRRGSSTRQPPRNLPR